MNKMKVYLGADHRGFELKEKIKPWIQALRVEVIDLGASEYNQDDDYPIIAEKVGKSIVKDPESLGILLCGSGVGASSAANKIDGVIAAIGVSSKQVRAGRNDDDMNVLVLAADETSLKLAKELIKALLEQEFGKKDRYIRRLDEIKKLEIEN